MLVTLLGTSDAAGIPVHGCECATCREAHGAAWLHRTQTCILVQTERVNMLIDMGSDAHIRHLHSIELAAVFLTHTHDDHMRGLFALRWTKQLALPVYHPQSADGGELFRKPRQLVFQSMASMAEVVFGGALAVKALPLNHGVPTQGYLVRDGASSAAVLLDTSGVPQQTLDHLTGHRPDLLVIDSTFAPGGMASETHNGVDEALHIIKEVNPRRAVLTHLSHDNWTYHDLVRYVYEQDRARSVVAYDGLRVKL